ncbi:MAG: methyltransferase domain-containing protein [Ruminococcus sp.]|nr:methyltransferase domain-containing protein [Ruminococcus sp.]
MKNKIFTCPVCGQVLEFSEKSGICPKQHLFDRAKSGYVNLLLSKHIGKTVHGDNKLMVKARREFLDRGYYSPLCEMLCDTVRRYADDESVILDAGCGEGYYTDAVKKSVSAEIFGIDISKTAVDYAAKRSRDIFFAAASVFHIPVRSLSCDILISLFAPYCGEEFSRVLKNHGIMIMAIPSENHLWELKKAVYDTPYKNTVKPYELQGFDFIGSERISFETELNSPQDIRSLFSMTPYYYRTGRKEQERLEALQKLETQCDFELLTYRKSQKEG